MKEKRLVRCSYKMTQLDTSSKRRRRIRNHTLEMHVKGKSVMVETAMEPVGDTQSVTVETLRVQFWEEGVVAVGLTL